MILWLFLSTAFACDLKQDVLSFSAPVTGIIEDLDLLNSTHLKGVSIYHPIPSNSSVKRWPGGTYIPEKTLRHIGKAVVFFDESAALKKRLSRFEVTSIEVQTKGATPFKVHAKALEQIRPYLSNCSKLEDKEREWKKIEETLINQKPFKRNFYFYLGKISQNKWPD